MRSASIVACGLTLLSLVATRAEAQDAPPPIGRFVADVRGTFPRFTDQPQLAESRGMSIAELPGSGLGIDVNAHFYVFTWRAVTFGLGGQVTLARAHSARKEAGGRLIARAVTEHFTSIAPQISFNFGTGDGWSYISGGIGPSTWSVVADGARPLPGDEDRLQTINYGGGARWFAKPRIAFTLDVRFYAINPGIAELGFPGSPRTTMLIFGAGVSVK